VDVVRGLALVDVVVGMDEALLSALAAEELARAVGEHFVHVHVGLRPRAGLPDGEREFALVLALDDLVGRLDDGLAFLGVEQPQGAGVAPRAAADKATALSLTANARAVTSPGCRSAIRVLRFRWRSSSSRMRRRRHWTSLSTTRRSPSRSRGRAGARRSGRAA